MKRFILITLSFLAFSNTTMAVPAPEACPSVESIRAVPFAGVLDIGFGYAAFSINNFATEQEWVFSIAGIFSQSEADAMTKAQESLSTLSGNPEPLGSVDGEYWACLYDLDNQGYMATAVYPVYGFPLKNISGLLKLRK